MALKLPAKTATRRRIQVVPIDDVAVDKTVKALVEQVHGLQDELPSYALCSVTFLVPDTDTEVVHGLGRAAAGYTPVRKSAACDVYDGVAPANRSNTRSIWVRGTVATTVTLRIF